MSQTKQERKKIAKKNSRRKSYVKVRNRLKGRKQKIKLKQEAKKREIDGAEYYRKIKEQEAAKKVSQSKKGNIFTKLIHNFTRGRQK